MQHTIIALVEDKPGVLNRIVSLFRRRNYNIKSLAVGPCETPGVSRLTIVTDENDSIRQNLVCNNLLKLINVIEVEDVTNVPTVIRENVLIKVQVNAQNREELKNIAKERNARIVDEGERSMILEVTESVGKIQATIDVLRPYGILEIVRSGKIAITRGDDRPEIKNGVAGRGTESSRATEQVNNYLY
ncbi:MAG: acetolactate synthase small subunit [FCB group bacterium]|nr:acetolactate synthase small subunit [FCB group bacterium]